MTQLGIHIGTTIDNSGPDPRPIGKFPNLVMDLADQLAGGSKYQHGGVSLTRARVGWSPSIGWEGVGTLGEGSRKDGEEEASRFTKVGLICSNVGNLT